MSERIHVLAQQLFGKSSVAECDLQEIKNLAQRYPYFAPAQFLLLEKLKQEGSPEYGQQLQKSVLYYHNPLEFEYFISSGRFYADDESRVLDPVPVPVPEPAAASVPVPESPVEYKTPEPPEEIPAEEIVLAIVERQEQEQDQDQVDINPPPSDQAIFHEEQTFTLEKPVVPEGNEVLAFEPYHTVDYFASQGIKLSQEEQPKDKFGKQLKSFTEWLKSMKKLPAKQMAAQAESSSEVNVQHLADDSVHESDVVTEAMAEVWIKQGNTQKALEVYNKLSLQNPSKRAYFAAKIDHLK